MTGWTWAGRTWAGPRRTAPTRTARMWTRRTWAVCLTAATLGAAAAMSAPGLARAQFAIVEPGPSGPVCDSVTTADHCNPDAPGCPPDRPHCMAVPGTSEPFFCFPNDAPLFCVPEGATQGCPEARTPSESVFAEMRVCVPSSGFGLCSADARPCFQRRSDGGGTEIVDYLAGDCDRDGLHNEGDPDRCQAARRLGVNVGGEGCLAARPCLTREDCPEAAVCDGLAGSSDPHRYCQPAAVGFIFCCGGFAGLVCPSSASPDGCQVSGAVLDDFGFCEPFPYCTRLPFAERVACLYRGADFPVAAEEGDCDGDGLLNAELAEETPCGGGAATDAGVLPVGDASVVPVPDGGDALPDAGPTGADAGEPADGGAPAADAGDGGREPPDPTPMDAGAAPVQPSFSGGGGCRCRAATARAAGGEATAWSLAAALGLLAGARRRRRAQRRR